MNDALKALFSLLTIPLFIAIGGFMLVWNLLFHACTTFDNFINEVFDRWM